MSSHIFTSAYPIPMVRPKFAHDFVLRRAHELISRMKIEHILACVSELSVLGTDSEDAERKQVATEALETYDRELSLISNDLGIRYIIDIGCGQTVTGSAKSLCAHLALDASAKETASQKFCDAKHWQSFVHVGREIILANNDGLNETRVGMLPHIRLTAHLFQNNTGDNCVADMIHFPCENTPPKFLLFKPMIAYLDSNPLGEHTAYADHPNHPGFMKPSTMMNVPVFTHGITGQQFFLFFTMDEKKDTHLVIRLLEDLPEDLYKLVPSTFIPTAAPMQQTQSPDEATK